ncbi:MAG: response regulator [Bacteroidota bacterium]
MNSNQGIGNGVNILVAEDDEISYLLIEEMLSEYNVKILHAENGEESIRIVKENPEISLVLMDVKMPVMNGLDACMTIRQFNPTIPIIAQSAYTSSYDRDRAFRSGCNDFISKPFDKEKLLSVIKKYSS